MRSSTRLGPALAIAFALWGCSPEPQSPKPPASAATASEPLARVSPEPAAEAWWLRIEFRPAADALKGISVAALDPDWVLATALHKDMIPPQFLLAGGHDGMAAGRQAFSRLGDFNRDGVEDEALVGVYRDKRGNQGKFMLIVTKRPGGWEKLWLETDPSKAGYLALGAQGDNLLLWDCMECGAVRELAWDAQAQRFYWVEAPADEPEPAQAGPAAGTSS